MIPFLTSPAPPSPSSNPPTSSSSLRLLLQRRGAPVVCVTVDPCKEDRSNISPPVYEAFRWGLADMMIGADGRTGPRVLKSVTDSGGFDSPRSSHTGSPKTPGEKRGEDEEGGLRRGGCKRERERAGNKSICRVVRAGGGSSRGSSRQRLFEVYTRPSPPFLFLFSPLPLLISPKAFCFPCPWMPHSCFLLSFSLSYPLVIPRVHTRDGATPANGSSLCLSASIPWRVPKPVSLPIVGWV